MTLDELYWADERLKPPPTQVPVASHAPAGVITSACAGEAGNTKIAEIRAIAEAANPFRNLCLAHLPVDGQRTDQPVRWHGC